MEKLKQKKLPWAAKILMMVQIFIVGTFQKWSPVDVNWQGGGGGWSPSLTLKTFLAGEATMMMMMMMMMIGGGGGDDDDDVGNGGDGDDDDDDYDDDDDDDDR